MGSLPTTCAYCGAEFGDPRNGWGDVNEPLCLDCEREMDAEWQEEWYGVAPHVHNFAHTGTFLGSTELLKLPEPGPHGWIDLTPLGGMWVGTWFRPDEEAPGCGIYTRDPGSVAGHTEALNV